MFAHNLNESSAALICRYTTPYDVTDYEHYHAEFARLMGAARAHRRKAILIIDIQDGYPQPNAVQRKSIGEAWAKAADVDAAIVVLTGSTLIRGVITAIDWFLKNSVSHRVTRPFARVSDAVTWLQEQTGVDAKQLSAEIETVRASTRHAEHAHP